MIDTHAHLNTDAFDKIIDDVLLRAKEKGVDKIIVIGMDLESNIRAIELADTYDMIYASIGIHPSYVDLNQDIDIKKYLNHPKVVAVGEIGTDLYHRKDNIDLQEKVFTRQLEIAISYKLPVIIHTRESFLETYEILKKYKGKIEGVFHCYSATLDDLEKALDLGFYIGFDGPITFKKNVESIDIIKRVPLNRILIETDSPYLAPMPFRGKQNEPSYVYYVLNKISEILEMPMNELDRITTENAYRLFKKLGEDK